VAYGDGPYPDYVSAAERRRRIERTVRALEREGRDPRPVRIEGRDIATTFWGKAWCAHVESLADLATRLPRGRSYARSGAVVDLKIAPGEVRALVSGTEVYEARVRVAPLAPARWEAVRRASTGRIANLVDLLAGKLPPAVLEVLCHRDDGLGIFPATEELDLTCSCPDGARLCKHLAAVLYGIGARLDQSPELLFVLRGVDPEALVAAAGDAASSIAGAAAHEERPGLRPQDLAEIFGIELERGAPAALPPAPTPRRKAPGPKAPRGRGRPPLRGKPAGHARSTGGSRRPTRTQAARRSPKR
jgi:uncharacterized Zn finger protein